MRRKIIFLALIFFIILTVVTISLRGKSKIKAPNENKTISREKEYNSEGLLIVSVDTYPELFDARMENSDKITKSSGELYLSYYETEYVDENGESICENLKRISIFDEKLIEVKDIISEHSALCYDGPIVEEKSEKKETYILEFLNEKAREVIDEPFELVFPEKYYYSGQLQNIDSYGSLYDVQNVQKVIYPENVTEINIYGCLDLEYVKSPSRLNNCSINKCPRLEVELGITEDSNALMCVNVCSECKLKSFYIPKSVAVIDNSFNNCQSFEEHNVNEGVIMMTSSFNYNSSLKRVYIPDSVIIIKDCFLNCENLILSVGKGTSAEEYAIKNEIKYVYH